MQYIYKACLADTLQYIDMSVTLFCFIFQIEWWKVPYV